MPKLDNTNLSVSAESQQQDPSHRKEYRTPDLTVYGDIIELTRTQPNVGPLDAAFAPSSSAGRPIRRPPTPTP